MRLVKRTAKVSLRLIAIGRLIASVSSIVHASKWDSAMTIARSVSAGLMPVQAVTQNGQAEISGQLTTAGGEGIRNATVMLVGGTLAEPVYVRTGTFGN